MADGKNILIEVNNLKKYFPVKTGFMKMNYAEGRGRCELLHRERAAAWWKAAAEGTLSTILRLHDHGGENHL